MKVFQKKIILASQSPRRKELMERSGFEFEVRVKEVEESYPDDMPLEEVPLFLSKKKAEAARPFLAEADLVITADTVVILEGELLGKPQDVQDAKHMLNKISGKKHLVISGVTILGKEQERSFSVCLLYTSPSPRDATLSRMPSSA